MLYGTPASACALSPDNALAKAAEMTGYFHSETALANGEAPPDLQIAFIRCLYVDHGRGDAGGDSGFALGPVLMRPKSKGSVRLGTASPEDPPVIDFNMFGDPDDLERMVQGTRALKKVTDGQAMEAVATGQYLVPPNGNADTGLEELRDSVRGGTQTLYHPVGTCSIGKVVDGDLKVLGSENVRVVDASVMPEIPRANTNGPTVMIAEMAADLIKA
jgi:choline dehydrogenase